MGKTKKTIQQLCDRCARRSSCSDYKDNIKLASEGLSIAIMECDAYLDPNSAQAQITNISKSPLEA